jgi:hypothetical protein
LRGRAAPGKIIYDYVKNPPFPKINVRGGYYNRGIAKNKEINLNSQMAKNKCPWVLL